jgi:hypothetical protein
MARKKKSSYDFNTCWSMWMAIDWFGPKQTHDLFWNVYQCIGSQLYGKARGGYFEGLSYLYGTMLVVKLPGKGIYFITEAYPTTFVTDF